MAWKYDAASGAYYNDSDAPIKLTTTAETPGSNKNWLLWALAFLILIAAKKR